MSFVAVSCVYIGDRPSQGYFYKNLHYLYCSAVYFILFSFTFCFNGRYFCAFPWNRFRNKKYKSFCDFHCQHLHCLAVHFVCERQTCGYFLNTNAEISPRLSNVDSYAMTLLRNTHSCASKVRLEYDKRNTKLERISNLWSLVIVNSKESVDK